jgi:hypothetical protein
MNKELYNSNFNVKKNTPPKLFWHFTPAALKFSFKTIFKNFSIKSVIESIFLLLFILHVFSLNIDGLLILIQSILIANLITKIYASLNSYKNTNVFLNNLLNSLKILDSLFNKYLMIKGLCPLISLIYFVFNGPYFVIFLVLTSIIIFIYINYINKKFKDNYPLLYIFLNFLCISILISFIINQYIVYVGFNNKGSSTNMYSGYGGGDPKSPKPPRSEVEAWFKKKRKSCTKKFNSLEEYKDSEIKGYSKNPDHNANYGLFKRRDLFLTKKWNYLMKNLNNCNDKWVMYELQKEADHMKTVNIIWKKADEIYGKKYNKK